MEILKDKKTWFGRLIQKIFPGKEYRAYANAEDRKMTDQLIKKKIQDMLLDSKENLFKVVQHFFKTGNKDKAEFADSICNQLDLFRTDVKNAEYGFHAKNQSLTKDLEEDFSNIIQADASMVYYSDSIQKTSTELQLKVLSGEEIQAELMSILQNLKSLKEIFQQRRDYVSGISQILEIKEIK